MKRKEKKKKININLSAKTKKIIIICLTIIVVITLIAFSSFGKKTYNYMFRNGVYDYGKVLDIRDILGEHIDIGEYPEISSYTFKRAKVKDIGSTAPEKIVIDDKNITFLGNRSLVKIDGKLYVCYGRDY